MNATDDNAQVPQRWLRLACTVAAMLVIWLVVLPVLGRWGPLREMIQRNEAAGIDPRAFFYSDAEHLHYRDGLLRRR